MDLREIQTNTGQPQETREILNKQPNFTPSGTRKRQTTKAQYYKKGNNKDQSGNK